MYIVYYLKTNNRADFIADMLLAGYDLSAWGETDDRFETNGLLIDWIGQIPYSLSEEQEAENLQATIAREPLPHQLTYRPLLHVNILADEGVDIDTGLFQSTSIKTPTVPFRTFAT